MQQNRDRNGRPRNAAGPTIWTRDDLARTSAPSQDHNTPRSTGSSRYGYNGEPLSRALPQRQRQRALLPGR